MFVSFYCSELRTRKDGRWIVVLIRGRAFFFFAPIHRGRCRFVAVDFMDIFRCVMERIRLMINVPYLDNPSRFSCVCL